MKYLALWLFTVVGFLFGPIQSAHGQAPKTFTGQNGKQYNVSNSEKGLWATSFNDLWMSRGGDSERTKQYLRKRSAEKNNFYPCRFEYGMNAIMDSSNCFSELELCMHGMFPSNEDYIYFRRNWTEFNRKEGMTNRSLASTDKFKSCGKKVWELVDKGDFEGLVGLANHMRKGTLHLAGSVSYSSRSNSQNNVNPTHIRTQIPTQNSGAASSHHSYGTDIDDLDASAIEIMDVVEDEDRTANETGKSCLCYAGDFENLGICHTSDPNSPNYGRRNARGELISTYSTGDYPWTSACKHPIGERANLQEWHNNYNGNKR